MFSFFCFVSIVCSAGAGCTRGGVCVQMTRVQYMLIDNNGAMDFVPVEVPNHCACAFF